MISPLRSASLVRNLWNATALVMVVAYVTWRVARQREFTRLAERLGYSGPSATFPIAYFRTVAREGAGPQEVWAGMAGYDSVSYYLVPIVGGSDSILVQRFSYPMRWDVLNVEVEYSDAHVRDIETGGDGRLGAHPIPAIEAYSRLGWRPPE